ncbi:MULTISPECIES: cation-translocating P-type ATPase [Brucella/Ochrobactrum group]|uniref:cation-translocating P-type ATPase n=1 Tax=Brucella/Ochrobactrum group TaxID=2826938 RepID=UPI00124D99A6|nr:MULTISPECIES: cation-translocating P-type ATPase [Brucella/Ochrobactrum group]KAB2758341.1 cation-translocating P-type ATPase [Brucella anthropi]MCQ9147175.1 cation-translocating P-type ATPase [Ochrobactrum sp. BTU2]
MKGDANPVGAVIPAPTDYSQNAAAHVVDVLASHAERGLTKAEAARRLAEYGHNRLRAAKAIPVWRRVLAQFQDPLVYLLLGAIIIALAAWVIEGRHGWPIDAVVIAMVVLANAILGFVQDAKAANAVAALARMTAANTSVLRDGERIRIPSADLVPGDIMLLEEGDAVGADGRLISAASLRIQEASLTGESEAVLKDAAMLRKPAPLAERFCMVFKGTAVVQGTARAIVTATGMRTEIGAIAQMLDASKEDISPLQKEVARVGRALGAAVIAIALIVVATVLLVSDIDGPSDVISVLLMGVSLAVAAVPEGLPAILSLVLALGVQRMATRKAVVKALSSVETLGSASIICSDKTGTLTRSEMTIEHIMTASGGTRVSGVGYAPFGDLEVDDGKAPSAAMRAEQIVVLSGGSLAGNAALNQGQAGVWEIQGDPTEAAFLVAERKLGIDERRKRRFERIAEIPFSSDRKMMSTVERDHEHGGARVLIAKGAPDVLMTRCTHVRVGMDVVPFDAVQRARATADVDRLSDEALRTLAVAYRPMADTEGIEHGEGLEHDLIFVGTVGIIDPPRKEAAVAISQARRAGIRVIMITGDHPRTASRIAALLGIVDHGARALTGAELDAMDEAAFAAAVRTTSVYARVAPVHKLRIVDTLQADGNVVAMTGDGVNDAPALKAADIGVAMGITGTEVTKEAARMILADDNFATIVEAVREGRGIFDNIRKFLRYLLSSNIGEVLTVFLGVVGAGVIGLTDVGGGGLVLPLLATQILWINLITDSGPALAMGIDPQDDGVMARPPRRPDEHAIDARMWRSVAGTGLVMALATLLTIDFYLPSGLIEGSQNLERARTAAFTVLVFAQLFNCFNARSEFKSAFSHLFSNKWLWAAVGLSVVLQIAVVNLSFLNTAFGTLPLSLDQWLFCVAMSSSVLWFSEIRKWISRRYHPSGPNAITA